MPGIVTAKVSNGFFFEDPNADGDPATSEGLFVFGTAAAGLVSVGDSVQVGGFVAHDPAKLVDRAISFWGVQVSDSTRRALLTSAQKTMGAAVADDDRQRKFPPMTLNALRHLVAASPEMQTS